MAFIDAKEVRLQALLSNAQEAYKVPLYQRPYAWTRDQWEDLFEDVNSLNKDDVHFLGSVVVVPEGPHTLGVNYFQVVDGQQRLATILIWLSAIRDTAKENGNTELSTYLTETFLFAREWRDGKQITVPKLQLGELDDDAFQRVLKGEFKPYGHLIFECYNYFKENTENEEIWQLLLNNVSVVHINAFNHFNAFRLFETLNDRGLELSAVDLIKNFLLMSVSSNREIFDQTVVLWNDMYEKVRSKEPIKFLRRYILSNYKGKVSESRLYDVVRKKLSNVSAERILDFVKDLNYNATIYKKIVECTFPQKRINEKLQELHWVEVGTSFTLFLKVMRCLEAKKISEETAIRIMDGIEAFHIRWGVCGLSTSKLDQIYNEICMDLEDIRPQEYDGIIKQRLIQEIRSNADDETFRRSFAQRSFRPTESRTKFILWRLSEPTGETILNIKEIHTEHILPQNLSSDWLSYLRGKTSKTENEIKAFYKENVNRIGNLTIIKGEWNIAMSNRLFEEKKEDYRRSEFSITKELSEYEEWTFESIEKRSLRLAEKACEIWKIK